MDAPFAAVSRILSTSRRVYFRNRACHDGIIVFRVVVGRRAAVDSIDSAACHKSLLPEHDGRSKKFVNMEQHGRCMFRQCSLINTNSNLNKQIRFLFDPSVPPKNRLGVECFDSAKPHVTPVTFNSIVLRSKAEELPGRPSSNATPDPLKSTQPSNERNRS